MEVASRDEDGNRYVPIPWIIDEDDHDESSNSSSNNVSGTPLSHMHSKVIQELYSAIAKVASPVVSKLWDSNNNNNNQEDGNDMQQQQCQLVSIMWIFS